MNETYQLYDVDTHPLLEFGGKIARTLVPKINFPSLTFQIAKMIADQFDLKSSPNEDIHFILSMRYYDTIQQCQHNIQRTALEVYVDDQILTQPSLNIKSAKDSTGRLTLNVFAFDPTPSGPLKELGKYDIRINYQFLTDRILISIPKGHSKYNEVSKIQFENISQNKNLSVESFKWIISTLDEKDNFNHLTHLIRKS